MSEQDAVYLQHRQAVFEAVASGVRQMAHQLVGIGFDAPAIIDGMTGALLQAVSEINASDAPDTLLIAAAGSLNADLGGASPEVTIQALRERLPLVLKRIEGGR